LEDALDRVEEEHQAIIFLYKSNRQRFENDILQKKDPFTKTLANMCRVLAGWKNRYKHNRFSDANDGVAFTTTDGPASQDKGKNKKITCYNCKKQGQYAMSDGDDNHDETTT